MIQIIPYSPELKDKWNRLILSSRNGTFLFLREYMDYHSDRFKDCSFLIQKNGNIEAVIPGNENDKKFFSHQGLTYGGLIVSEKMLATDIIETFSTLNDELIRKGIREVFYKPVPLIYHKIPAQEDIYALFLQKAQKYACHLSSSIYLENKIKFTESRKSGIRKSINNSIEIEKSIDYELFWSLVENNLAIKYNKKPVHSLTEIKLLSEIFPENIKLYIAKYNEEIIAGCVIYIVNSVAHVQYISSSETGRNFGALDLLFDFLINSEFKIFSVFDFGYSTEDLGHFLNEKLIFQKEGFGARGIVYESYSYEL